MTQVCVAGVLEFQSDTGGVCREVYFLTPKVFKNSSPANVQWSDSCSRTQTTRAAKACVNSPLATTFTHTPGASARLVRTLAPRGEMSTVIAESSALKGSVSNTRLIGIDAGWRSHRRGVCEVFSCHGTSLLLLFVRLPRMELISPANLVFCQIGPKGRCISLDRKSTR